MSEHLRDLRLVSRLARRVAAALSVSTIALTGGSAALAGPSAAFASSPGAFVSSHGALAGPSAALVAQAAAPGVTYTPSLALVSEFSAAGLGQGTMLTTTLELGGYEYFGTVAPMTELRLLLPVGVTASAADFPTCSVATLGTLGPFGCQIGSRAGEHGRARLYVTLGGERVEEGAEVWPYFEPGGGLGVYIVGHSPLSVGLLAEGSLAGDVLTLSFPLIPGVLDSPYVSIGALTLNLGSARVEEGRSLYSLTMPDECPAHRFTWSAEVLRYDAPFEGSGGADLGALHATAESPCPASSSGESALPGTDGVITAPPNTRCVSRRDFVIHVQQLKGVIYRRVSVEVNEHAVAVVKGTRFQARVDLRGLPKGRYTVRITVLTTSGRRIAGTRAYHTCAATPLRGGKPRL